MSICAFDKSSSIWVLMTIWLHLVEVELELISLESVLQLDQVSNAFEEWTDLGSIFLKKSLNLQKIRFQ